jgi:hypothetical protein
VPRIEHRHERIRFQLAQYAGRPSRRSCLEPKRVPDHLRNLQAGNLFGSTYLSAAWFAVASCIGCHQHRIKGGTGIDLQPTGATTTLVGGASCHLSVSRFPSAPLSGVTDNRGTGAITTHFGGTACAAGLRADRIA